MDTEILTIKEVAEYLKVNERTIYRLANKGDIPAFKVGNIWRFERSKIAQWMEAKPQQSNNKEKLCQTSFSKSPYSTRPMKIQSGTGNLMNPGCLRRAS